MKRTEALDRAKEIPLPPLPDGTPVHTTVGDRVLTGPEKEELSSNIKATVRSGAIQEASKLVIENAARFSMSVLENIAPEGIVRAAALAFTEGDAFSQRLAESWIIENGFSLKQDGLTSVVYCKGQRVAEMTARVPEAIAGEVEREIRRITRSH